jgi:hypothetical protein
MLMKPLKLVQAWFPEDHSTPPEHCYPAFHVAVNGMCVNVVFPSLQQLQKQSVLAWTGVPCLQKAMMSMLLMASVLCVDWLLKLIGQVCLVFEMLLTSRGSIWGCGRGFMDL